MHREREISWSLPTYPIFGIKPPSSLFSKDRKKGENSNTIQLLLHGSIETIIEIDQNSTPSDIEGLLETKNLVFVHNGRVLSRALSLQFMGIQEGDSIYVVDSKKDEKVTANYHSSLGSPIPNHRKFNFRHQFSPSSTNLSHLYSENCSNDGSSSSLVSPDKYEFGPSYERLKYRFDQKWAQKFNDPDSAFEKIKLYSDPSLANESARLEDLYRTRIEGNVSAFRKVCDRFSHQGDNVSCNQNEIKSSNIQPTVLPEKPILPSTQLLPGM